MKQRIGRGAKRNTANFFGSIGYLICSLQWLWAVMLYFSVLQSMVLFVSPSTDGQAGHAPALAFALPSPVEVAIFAVVTIAMVVITAYALIKMPMGIVKTSNEIVHKTAETMAPAAIKAQHKKDTKKARVLMTARLTLAIKSLLVAVPLVLTAGSGLLEQQSLGYPIAMAIGCGLAVLGAAFFAAQYALAGLLRVKMQELW